MREILRALRDDADSYCDGKTPWLRAALLGYLAYAGAHYMADPFYASWFSGITLVFHEMGHIVFAPFGETLKILGGSLMQLIVPTAAAVYLLRRQGDWFGLVVGASWLAFAAWELATYIGDANKESLPLVSMGGTPEHDWSRLLTGWHWLNSCDEIATAVRVAAFSIWAPAMTLGAWLVLRMARRARPA
jgi:hypothetical protein